MPSKSLRPKGHQRTERPDEGASKTHAVVSGWPGRQRGQHPPRLCQGTLEQAVEQTLGLIHSLMLVTDVPAETLERAAEGPAYSSAFISEVVRIARKHPGLVPKDLDAAELDKQAQDLMALEAVRSGLEQVLGYMRQTIALRRGHLCQHIAEVFHEVKARAAQELETRAQGTTALAASTPLNALIEEESISWRGRSERTLAERTHDPEALWTENQTLRAKVEVLRAEVEKLREARPGGDPAGPPRDTLPLSHKSAARLASRRSGR